MFDVLSARFNGNTVQTCRAVGISRSIFYEVRDGSREPTEKMLARLEAAVNTQQYQEYEAPEEDDGDPANIGIIKKLIDQVSSLKAAVAHVSSLRESPPQYRTNRTDHTEDAELPLCGGVCAGRPGDFDPYSGETIRIHGGWPAHYYVVRVSGKSMESPDPDEMSYPDGAFVIVRPLGLGEFARKGDVVICFDAHGAYIKKLEYRKPVQKDKSTTLQKPTPHLVSINPDYDEIVPVTELPIRGVAVGIAVPVRS